MLKKNIKPVLLAGALALATAVSPVLADDGGNDDQKIVDTNHPVEIKKNLNYAKGYNTINQTFNFSITPKAFYTYYKTSGEEVDTDRIEKSDTEKWNNSYLNYFPKVTDNQGTEISNIKIKINTTDTTLTSKYETENIYFTDATAPTNGVFEYTLVETTDSNNNNIISWSSKEYTIFVKVTNDANGNPSISEIRVKDETAQQSDKRDSIVFDNTYAETNGVLEIGKTITGSEAEMNKQFEFSVYLEAPSNSTVKNAVAADEEKEIIAKPGTTVTVNIMKHSTEEGKDDVDTGRDATLEYGTTRTIELGNGEYVKFERLAVGTTYKVIETEANTKGYTSTVVTGDNGVKNNSKSADKTNGESGLIYDNENNDKESVALYTNTKEGNIITGVIVNNMPYIALLGASGAGLVVLAASKKRSK